MRRNSAGSGRRIIIALLVAAVVLATGIGALTYTFALYKTQSDETAVANAKDFRFGSDYLTDAVPAPEYDVYTTPFTVNIYNFENGNRSAVDIGYTVQVINGSCDKSSGTLPATADTTETLTITPSGEGDVVVTVTSSPYEKVISAVFNIAEQTTATNYSYTDNGDYGTLVINTGLTGSVPASIEWDSAKLAPDSTNPLMGTSPASPFTFSPALSPNSTYTINFFENTPGDYTSADINLN